MDHSPLVAITGQGAITRLHKESHQAMDVVGLFDPVTKWSTSVRDARTLSEVVRKAFKTAVAEKPGATHIELPEDIAKEQVDDAPILPSEKVRRPIADSKSIDSAVALLRAAQRPVLLVGNGCVRTRVTKQLQRFVDTTGCYAASTFMAKGALDDANPKSLMAAGLGTRDHVNQAFEAADLVIAIGYDVAEWGASRWNPTGRTPILHIDFQPAEVDSHYHPTVEVVGDVAAALWAINESLGDHRFPDSPANAAIRERLLGDIAEHSHGEAAAPLKPQRILSELRAEMRSEDILISDVGAHKMWVARNYPVNVPNTCLITNGFCSMGIALPGAVAAALVHPERRVVSLSGDGGFLMNVQELATAVRLKVPTVNLIWEDGEFGLITWKQEIEFKRHFGTQFSNPDFVALAQSFGAHAERVESADSLRTALRAAFERTDTPTVIVVPVDYRENLALTRYLGSLVAAH